MFVKVAEKRDCLVEEALFVPEDFPKLVLEVTAGGVEVVQVGQDTALG